MPLTIQGLPASSGTAIGPVWVYRPVSVSVERREVASPDAEWQRLEAALARAGEQLAGLRERAASEIGEEEAAIFDAQALVASDPELIEQLREKILEERVNAEAAVQERIESYAQTLQELDNEYLSARSQDVRDVGRRILYALEGISPEASELPETPVVIAAEDLAPSDTVQFKREMILGFCTARGGPTAHTAILARSLNVPAVVSAPLPLETLQNGTTVIVDGSSGTVRIDPSEAELAQARERQSRERAAWDEQLAAAREPAITVDGVRVEVAANIGGVEDARMAVEFGAEGVGLLRTEFLYLDRAEMPGEEEQARVYREIFAILGDRPVVARTLDIGGDKAFSGSSLPAEPNPFLGWRGIRTIRERPDLLLVQFRALLRAGANARLRIMVPMVSSIEEARAAKALLEQARRELDQAGVPTARGVQFGIMVEVPSAALLAEPLAEVVDFFSIGANDLTQYTLAVDRTNERVAALASPLHPAVAQLIARTIRAAHQKNRWVGLCGEMAGDPLAAPLLLGLGLDEFSMAPKSIPAIKERLRRLDSARCQEAAEKALRAASTEEVEALLRAGAVGSGE